MSVDRFKPEVVYHDDDAGYPSGDMYKTENGDWVKFEDYQRLQAELAEAKAQIEDQQTDDQLINAVSTYEKRIVPNLKAQLSQVTKELDEARERVITLEARCMTALDFLREGKVKKAFATLAPHPIRPIPTDQKEG